VQLGDRYTTGCKLGISNTHTENQRREREGATWQHLIGPPQHVSATCQHLIGPPHPCGSHMSDKWVLLVPRVSISLVHLTQPLPHGRMLSHPVRPPRDTWQHLIGPHHHICHMVTCEWSTAAREVPHGSTQRSHLSMSVPHGSLLLVHLSRVGPTTILT
jgi:hypothetical protein